MAATHVSFVTDSRGMNERSTCSHRAMETQQSTVDTADLRKNTESIAAQLLGILGKGPFHQRMLLGVLISELQGSEAGVVISNCANVCRLTVREVDCRENRRQGTTPRDSFLRPMVDLTGAKARLRLDSDKAARELQEEFDDNRWESQEALKYAGASHCSSLSHCLCLSHILQGLVAYKEVHGMAQQTLQVS